MSKLSEKYGAKVSKREEQKIQKAMEEQKSNSFKDVPAGELWVGNPARFLRLVKE